VYWQGKRVIVFNAAYLLVDALGERGPTHCRSAASSVKA
jgi:hypothetical protein